MPVSMKMLADVADIQMLRLSCQKCGAAVGLSFEKPLSVPKECSHCHERWFPPDSEEDYRMVDWLLSAVDSLRKRTTGCKVQLEFDAPS